MSDKTLIDDTRPKKLPMLLGAMVYIFPALVLGLGAIASHLNGANFTSINHDYYYKPTAVILLVILVVVGLFCIALYFKLEKKNSADWAIFILMLVALLLRLAAIYFIPVAQESDFGLYWQMGNRIAAGDIAGARTILEEFGLNSLSGLAIMNGALCAVSGNSVVGLEVAQALVQCATIYAVYQIGLLINRRTAYMAALLLTVYPSGIIYVTVSTNQHLSTMFLFCSLAVLLKGLFGSMINACGVLVRCGIVSGVLLALSYYSHPSTLPIIAAIVVWLIYAVLKKPHAIKMCIIVLLSVIVSYSGAKALGDAALMAVGVTGQSSDNGSMLGKFVVGLNYETAGQVVSPYKGYVNEMDLLNHIPKDQLREYCLDRIYERATDPRVAELLVKKERYMWHEIDNSHIWVEISSNAWAKNEGKVPGVDNLFELSLCEAFKKVDYLYLMFIYSVFSITSTMIACLSWRGGSKDNILKIRELLMLPMLALDAWIVVFLLIEIQGRYRYAMMPIIFLVSAIGITLAIKKIESAAEQHSVMSRD